MASSLIVVDGLEPGRRLILPEAGEFTLGRGEQADGRLAEGGVSRLHCVIAVDGGAVRLRDLGSANGTRVNGAPATDILLNDGDLLTLGAVTLRFAADEAENADNADNADNAGNDENTGTVENSTKKSEALFSTEFAADLSSAYRMTLDPSRALDLAAARGDDARVRGHFNALHHFAARLDGAAEAADVARLATDTVFDVTGAENAAMVLRGDDGAFAAVYCRARHGDGESFVISQSAVHEATSSGVSLFSADAGADRRLLGASIVAQRIRSLMCVPVRGHGRPVGAIYADRRIDDARFGKDDLAVMAAIGHQAGVALERAKLVEDLRSLFVGAMRTMIMSLEAKDPYTRGHSERVARYALALADRLGWDPVRRDALELGGLMHDIGKIGVPDRVLGKAGRLDEEEFSRIRRHPGVGGEIIGQMPKLDRLVAVDDIVAAVRHHHEKWDGTGYPDGLAGERIPETARVLAVVDTFDALTTSRPYREGRTPEEARRILESLFDTQLHGGMARVFLELVDEGLPDRLDAVPARFLASTRIDGDED